MNVDASLFKDTKLTERVSLQFRAESFNLLNSTTFGNPDGNINSSTFGVITSLRTNTGPRNLQFGLRLYF